MTDDSDTNGPGVLVWAIAALVVAIVLGMMA